jgi:hypothetical protein
MSGLKTEASARKTDFYSASTDAACARRSHLGARLKPGEDIGLLLYDDARREDLPRRAWGGEEP